MKKPYKILIWVALGIWVIALIMALSPKIMKLHREKENAEKTFAAFSGNLVNQRYQDAYGLSGSDFRQAASFDEFVEQQKKYRDEFGSLTSVHQAASDVEGKGTPMFWRAVIDADLVFEKKTVRFEFVFRQEGGRWVLFGYQQM
jgi:hypothetical protein